MLPYRLIDDLPRHPHAPNHNARDLSSPGRSRPKRLRTLIHPKVIRILLKGPRLRHSTLTKARKRRYSRPTRRWSWSSTIAR